MFIQRTKEYKLSPLFIFTIAFTSIMIVVICDVTPEFRYVYLVCYVKYPQRRLSLSGYTYTGCWNETCSLEVLIYHKTIQVVEIKPYDFQIVAAPVYVPTFEEPLVGTVRISTQHRITVIGGTWNGDMDFYDAFTLYPVQTTDTSYDLTIAELTRYVAILTMYDRTTATIAYMKHNASILEIEKAYLRKKNAYMFYIKDDIVAGTGVTVSADGPIVLYFGDDTIQAAVRPINTYGRHFLITSPGMDRKYFLTFYQHYDVDSRIKCVNELGHVSGGVIMAPKDFPGLLQMVLTFKSLHVTSVSPVAVVMSYEAHDRPWNKKALSLLVPTAAFQSKYLLSIPYEADKRKTSSRMLSLIAKHTDVARIEVNRVNVSEWFKTPLRPVTKNDGYSWADLDHVEAMLFTVIPDDKGVVDVKFGIYLYGASTDGVYHTEASGQAVSSHVISVHRESEGGGGSISSVPEWLLFGVLMPMSLGSLILLFILPMKRKAILAKEEQQAADQRQSVAGSPYRPRRRTGLSTIM